MREYIARDPANQYVIIGRNPCGLMLTKDNVYELISEKNGDKVVFKLN